MVVGNDIGVSGNISNHERDEVKRFKDKRQTKIIIDGSRSEKT